MTGAYVYALTSVVLGWPFPLALLAAGAAGGILSLTLSLPSWRLKSDSFVMVSLAVQILLCSLIYNWYDPTASLGTWQNLTNGPFGIAGVPRPVMLGYDFDTIASMAALSVSIAGILMVSLYFLLSSPWGRVLRAMRDDELACRALGKNTRYLTVQAACISCVLAGVSGAIYSSYSRYIDPSLGSLDVSILLLAMVVIGGIGNLRGPIIGAILLLLLPEALRHLEIPSAMAADIRLMAYGLLLILMMHFRPQGVAGCYRIE